MKTEYRLISGTPKEVEKLVSEWATDGGGIIGGPFVVVEKVYQAVIRDIHDQEPLVIKDPDNALDKLQRLMLPANEVYEKIEGLAEA